MTQEISRQHRRAMRLQRLVSDSEAHKAAMQAGLDFLVSGESGALVVLCHSLSWHRAKSPNITIPPAGRAWDKSGRARVVQEIQASVTTLVIQDQSGSSGTSNKNS